MLSVEETNIMLKFYKFLADNGVTKRVFNNRVKEYWNFDDTKDMLVNLERVEPDRLVTAGFSWNRTREGQAYWHNLHTKWGRLC